MHFIKPLVAHCRCTGALKQRIFFLHHPNVAFQGRDVILKWIEILDHDIFREKAEK